MNYLRHYSSIHRPISTVIMYMAGVVEIHAVVLEDRIKRGPEGCHVLTHSSARISILARYELTVIITSFKFGPRPSVPVR